MEVATATVVATAVATAAAVVMAAVTMVAVKAVAMAAAEAAVTGEEVVEAMRVAGTVAARDMGILVVEEKRAKVGVRAMARLEGTEGAGVEVMPGGASEAEVGESLGVALAAVVAGALAALKEEAAAAAVETMEAAVATTAAEPEATLGEVMGAVEEATGAVAVATAAELEVVPGESLAEALTGVHWAWVADASGEASAEGSEALMEAVPRAAEMASGCPAVGASAAETAAAAAGRRS